MPEPLKIPPFLVHWETGAVVFRFDPEALKRGEAYPPDLEGLLAEAVAQRAAELAAREIVIDLERLSAISSMQLSAMLAVRRACRKDGQVRIRNLRPNVRELLNIAKLGDFFTWDSPKTTRI